MGHTIKLEGRPIQVVDSKELFYKRKIVSLIENPDYNLAPHEETVSGMIKLLIENGECVLDQIRKS